MFDYTQMVKCVVSLLLQEFLLGIPYTHLQKEALEAVEPWAVTIHFQYLEKVSDLNIFGQLVLIDYIR